LPHSHGLAREALGNCGADFRWPVQGVLALQEACEQCLVGLFEGGQNAAVHGGRVTLLVKDLQLARRIRGDALRMLHTD
jgi:histone H3/H4